MAELKDLIKENDFYGEVLSAHTGTLTRAKIDTALVANGYTLPLPNKVSFHFFNGADMWLITWFPMLDKYGIEKLSLKG